MCKKGMFSNVEGPCLAPFSALSRKKKGIINEICLQFQCAC